MSKKFVKTDSFRLSKLGKGRKKKLKWKRARGRHNKLRAGKRGHPQIVDIGLRTAAKGRNLIMGKVPKLVHNIKELMNAGANGLVIIANIGKKKRKELIEKANQMKIKIINLKKSEGEQK